MTNSLALVPVFAGTINYQSVQLCDARTLHTFMGVLRNFSNWIKGRIEKFEFVNGIDFITVSRSPEKGSGDFGTPDLAHQTRGGNKKEMIDYHLTLDMAKELAMVENNPKGREARRYFIDCEKQTVTRPMLVPTPFVVLPGQTLNAAQADTLRDLLADFAGSMPLDLRGLIMREGWSKLKSHFKTDYRHIPASEFNEAISIVSRHIAKWAPSDVKKKEFSALQALPAKQFSQTLQLMRVVTENGVSTVDMLPIEAIPELVMREKGLFGADLSLKIASSANLRMMGNVMRTGLGDGFEQRRKESRRLDSFELMTLAQDLWMELGMRTALTNELAAA